jgi:hypothetical protein
MWEDMAVAMEAVEITLDGHLEYHDHLYFDLFLKLERVVEL